MTKSRPQGSAAASQEKDPWFQVPPAPTATAWSESTAQQWSAHTAAFDARGTGWSDQAPVLTVTA